MSAICSSCLIESTYPTCHLSLLPPLSHLIQLLLDKHDLENRFYNNNTYSGEFCEDQKVKSIFSYG